MMALIPALYYVSNNSQAMSGASSGPPALTHTHAFLNQSARTDYRTNSPQHLLQQLPTSPTLKPGWNIYLERMKLSLSDSMILCWSGAARELRWGIHQHCAVLRTATRECCWIFDFHRSHVAPERDGLVVEWAVSHSGIKCRGFALCFGLAHL